MNFEFSDKVKYLQKKLSAFMDEHIYPNEGKFYEQINTGDRWQLIPLIEELKAKAQGRGALEPVPARQRATARG